MQTLGTDVCWYDHPVNAILGRSRGFRYVAIRFTVGDYYTDANARKLWDAYKANGYLVTGYCVTAPKDNAGRVITAKGHLDRFVAATAGLTPDFGWVEDNELERGATKEVITQLVLDVAAGLQTLCPPNKRLINYTRQSWWDTWINPNPIWVQYDLWAARYAAWLTGPWSDGACVFRDYKDWKFWQTTATANGPYYGIAALEADLDQFNGSEVELYAYAHAAPPQDWPHAITDWAKSKGYIGPEPG